MMKLIVRGFLILVGLVAVVIALASLIDHPSKQAVAPKPAAPVVKVSPREATLARVESLLAQNTRLGAVQAEQTMGTSFSQAELESDPTGRR